MQILVLGAGGVGGYFGGRLAHAGADIQFLVRPSRAALLEKNGLTITSPLGNLQMPVRTLTQVNTTFDAIILSCKAYDLDNAIASIAPAVGPSTVILPLLNGIRHLDILDKRFGIERVLGGLCHIGVTMSHSGEIRHLDTLQRFIMGARTPSHVNIATNLHTILKRGGFEPVLSEVIMQDMWEKFTFLTTYAGITTLMHGAIGSILLAEEGEAIIREMLEECTRTATANGHAPRPTTFSNMETSLTERGSPGTSSMFRDMTNNNRTEHEHIIGDMLARARAAGISAPLLRVSLARMQTYDAIRLHTATS